MTNQVVAISGSLRTGSSNSAVLEALIALAPGHLRIILFDIAQLPHFNPDLDENPPEIVRRFKKLIAESSAFILSTPEYAHGIPGVLKNMLDWLVSSEEFYQMLVSLVYARPAPFAHASLMEILKTMNARVPQDVIVVLPSIRPKLTNNGKIEDPEVLDELRHFLDRLSQAM